MSTQVHSAVGAVMSILRWQWGLILLAGAFLLFWDPINSWLNFTKIEIEVTAVQTTCSATRPASRNAFRTGECDTLAAEYAHLPAVKLDRQTTYSFDYKSPADGLMHRGSIARLTDNAAAPIAVGDRIMIEASNRSPLHVREAMR
jgi:hypothetical protein